MIGKYRYLIKVLLIASEISDKGEKDLTGRKQGDQIGQFFTN
jgi:hypothetical protein